MTKVGIRNFQSISSANFVIDGFTVIVGKNNVGKSAVIRAIDAALTNQAGSDYIRTGTKQTEVDISRPGLEIEWKKGAKTTYKVNGEPFSALNRSIPKPISDAGFFKLEVGTEKLTPLVASQHDPLFLLDKPGSVITDVIAALYNLDTISKADDLCQKELKGQKSMLKTREMDLTTVRGKLVTYENFDAVKKQVSDLMALDARKMALEAEIATLLNWEEEIADLLAEIQSLAEVRKVVLPDTKSCGETLTEAEWLQTQESAVKISATKVRTLRRTTDIVVPSTEACAKLTEEALYIDRVQQTLETLQNQVEALARTHSVPLPALDQCLLDEVAWLTSALENIAETKLSVAGYEKASAIDLSAFEGKLAAIATAQKTFNEMNTATEEFLTLARTAKTSRDELKTVTTDLVNSEKEFSEFGTCPLCERPL